MSKRAQSIPEPAPPATPTKKTLGSIWRKHCAKPGHGHSDMHWLRSVLRNAVARLKYRVVRQISFEQLSSAGYDVQEFDDVCLPPREQEKTALRNMPKHWKNSQEVAVPGIAKLQDAVLFGNGAVLLPDKRLFIGGWGKRMPPELRSRYIPHGLSACCNNETALIQRNFRCIDLPGRCFAAGHKAFWNFGHFIHDMLSRVYYEELGAIVPGRDKVIAPPMPFPMQIALFHKVFESYEIVQTPPHAPLRVEELLLPKNLCSNPAAIGSLARRMRRIVAPYAGRDGRKGRVSRRGGRAFHAEEEACRNYANVDAYETRMREMGYDVVDVSALDPESQFSLWANTTDIVGIHGAGMMNMIMMPSGGNYTEIGATIGRSNTVRCAMAAGHQVRILENGARDAQGRLVIDLDRLEALLLDAP